MKEKYRHVICTQRKRNVFGLPWTFTEYILTDKKIIVKTGFFSIKEEEVELYKITDKKLFCPFLGRIFRYGSIEFNANDTYTPNVFIKNIRNPRDFLETFENAIDVDKEKYNVKGRDVMGMAD